MNIPFYYQRSLYQTKYVLTVISSLANVLPVDKDPRKASEVKCYKI